MRNWFVCLLLLYMLRRSPKASIGKVHIGSDLWLKRLTEIWCYLLTPKIRETFFVDTNCTAVRNSQLRSITPVNLRSEPAVATLAK